LPPGSFNLRGSDYLTEGSANKGAKTPSGACAFTAVSITVIDADRPLFGVCEQLRPLREYLEANKGTEFFVTNRACPVGGGVIRNIITTAKRTLKEGEDPVFDRVWASYKAGDAEYKVRKGGWEAARMAERATRGCEARLTTRSMRRVQHDRREARPRNATEEPLNATEDPLNATD